MTMRDILHIHERNPKSTIISDLSSGEAFRPMHLIAQSSHKRSISSLSPLPLYERCTGS